MKSPAHAQDAQDGKEGKILIFGGGRDKIDIDTRMLTCFSDQSKFLGLFFSVFPHFYQMLNLGFRQNN